MKNTFAIIFVCVAVLSAFCVGCEKSNIERFKKAEVITLENCEYYVCQGSYCSVLCHKGNCKNPIHIYNNTSLNYNGQALRSIALSKLSPKERELLGIKE